MISDKLVNNIKFFFFLKSFCCQINFNQLLLRQSIYLFIKKNNMILSNFKFTKYFTIKLKYWYKLFNNYNFKINNFYKNNVLIMFIFYEIILLCLY